MDVVFVAVSGEFGIEPGEELSALGFFGGGDLHPLALVLDGVRVEFFPGVVSAEEGVEGEHAGVRVSCAVRELSKGKAADVFERGEVDVHEAGREMILLRVRAEWVVRLNDYIEVVVACARRYCYGNNGNEI